MTNNHNQLFDMKLAKDFRRKYLEPNGFVFLYYYKNPNDDNKDLWNKICSSMDWIDIALTGLRNVNNITDYLLHHNNLQSSLMMFYLISTIAMLRDAVDSMWCAFYSGAGYNMYKPTKHRHYPFNNSNDIFRGSILKNPLNKEDVCNNEAYKKTSDDTYFTHIRAFFGVHSTNGNPIKYRYFNNKSFTQLRFFSSWSSSILRDGCYTVLMYCNNPKVSQYFCDHNVNCEFSVNIRNLIQFASFKYKSLIILACFIDYYKQEVINDFKSKPIKLDKHKSLLHQIISLRKFAKDTRIMSAYYGHNIDDYIKFLKLWKNMKDNNCLTGDDTKAIKSYLTNLNTHIISDYYKILNTGKFIRLKYIEATDITPEYTYGHRYSWEYRHIITLGNEDLNGNNFDRNLYYQCLRTLIDKNILPEYFNCFKPCELYLLLLSRTYVNNPSIINKNFQKSWIIY